MAGFNIFEKYGISLMPLWEVILIDNAYELRENSKRENPQPVHKERFNDYARRKSCFACISHPFLEGWRYSLGLRESVRDCERHNRNKTIKEVANVYFEALENATDGSGIKEGDIVLFLDSLKVSTIETTAQNVAAQGG